MFLVFLGDLFLNWVLMMNTTAYQTDQSIVQAIQNGDKLALEYLYTSRFPMIRDFIVKNNGSAEDAKDIYQEAIIVLYNNLQRPGFKLTSAINTYLYSVSRNLWLKHLKKNDKVSSVDLNESEEYLKIEDEGSYEQDIEQENTQKEEATILAMQKLGAPCNVLLTKYYYEKMSMQEIADEMNYKSAKIAKNQKYKCMLRLQALVKNILS